MGRVLAFPLLVPFRVGGTIPPTEDPVCVSSLSCPWMGIPRGWVDASTRVDASVSSWFVPRVFSLSLLRFRFHCGSDQGWHLFHVPIRRRRIAIDHVVISRSRGRFPSPRPVPSYPTSTTSTHTPRAATAATKRTKAHPDRHQWMDRRRCTVLD